MFTMKGVCGCALKRRIVRKVWPPDHCLKWIVLTFSMFPFHSMKSPKRFCYDGSTRQHCVFSGESRRSYESIDMFEAVYLLINAIVQPAYWPIIQSLGPARFHTPKVTMQIWRCAWRKRTATRFGSHYQPCIAGLTFWGMLNLPWLLTW